MYMRVSVIQNYIFNFKSCKHGKPKFDNFISYTAKLSVPYNFIKDKLINLQKNTTKKRYSIALKLLKSNLLGISFL